MNDGTEKGKGKGRATKSSSQDQQQNSQSSQSSAQNGNSMFERVIASAAGLAHSNLGAPTRNEINGSVNAALSGSGKVQASSSGNSEWVHNSESTGLTGSSSSSAQPAASFRTVNHGEQHGAAAEAEFSSFLDGMDSFQPSEGYNTSEQLNTFSGGDQDDNISHLPRDGLSYITIREQEERDGEAVSALLFDPNTTYLEGKSIHQPQVDEDPIIWNMTEPQKKQWSERLQSFPPGPVLSPSSTASKSNHPLNLIPHPDLRTPNDHQVNLTSTGQPRVDDWAEQWEGVLNRYTDEVWGDLLPLVKEARDEVAAAKEDPAATKGGEPKALSRLRQVLEHLR